MGVVYVAIGFLVVPAVLLVFHLLSRPPDVRPGRPPGVAEEAERWLRAQRRDGDS